MSSCLCCDPSHDSPKLLYFRHYGADIIFCEKNDCCVYKSICCITANSSVTAQRASAFCSLNKNITQKQFALMQQSVKYLVGKMKITLELLKHLCEIQFNVFLAISRCFSARLFQFWPTNLDLPSQDCVEFSFRSSAGSSWQRKGLFSEISDFYLTKPGESKNVWFGNALCSELFIAIFNF